MIFERRKITVSDTSETDRHTYDHNVDTTIGDLSVQKITEEINGKTHYFADAQGYPWYSPRPKTLIEETRGKVFFFDSGDVDFRNQLRWCDGRAHLYLTTEVAVETSDQEEPSVIPGSAFKRISPRAGDGKSSIVVLRHISRI